MNLNQLHYFSKLAEVEHYTKAAEELKISQPSLSHAIGSLEKELGTRLFEKQGRGDRTGIYLYSWKWICAAIGRGFPENT